VDGTGLAAAFASDLGIIATADSGATKIAWMAARCDHGAELERGEQSLDGFGSCAAVVNDELYIANGSLLC
jgi:hypothetical protein